MSSRLAVGSGLREAELTIAIEPWLAVLETRLIVSCPKCIAVPAIMDIAIIVY